MASADVEEEFPPPVHYDLNPEDYFAMSRHLRSAEELRWLSWPVLLFMCIVPTVLVAVVFPGYGPAFLAGTCVGIGGLLIRGEQVRSRASQALAPRSDGIFLGERIATLSADGVKVTGPKSTSEIHWTAILALEETEKHIFLRVDAMSAHVIPKRSFDVAESGTRFLSCIRRHLVGRASA